MEDITPARSRRGGGRKPPVVRGRLGYVDKGRLRQPVVSGHRRRTGEINELTAATTIQPSRGHERELHKPSRLVLLKVMAAKAKQTSCRLLKQVRGFRLPDGQTLRRAWQRLLHLRLKDVRRAGKQAGEWVVDRHWRLSYFAILALAIILPVAFSVYQNHVNAERYHLTASEQKLIGPASSQFAQLTYNAKDQQYVFNQSAFSSSMGDSTQAGGGSSPKTALYGAKLSTDDKQTLTVVDKTTQLSMSLTPLFSELGGKAITNAGQPQSVPQGSGQTEVDHVVAPVKGSPADHIYTVKNNGVKEDLLLTKQPSGASISFSYKLNLPDTLTARLDANGNLGIYSADPSLFGNITYGDSKSQAEVMKARQNSQKDNLVFILPAPIIYESGSRATDPAGSAAKFTLKGDVLTVTATGLGALQYPATIDPSIVDSSANLQYGGNNEGNISYANDEISTGGLTGGSTGTWHGSGNAMNYVALMTRSVTYNGYLYTIGGVDSSGNLDPGNDVQYAPINANGDLGTWQTTTNLPNALWSMSVVTYNGYLYVLGGCSTSGIPSCDYSGYQDAVYYAPINANGTLGTWQATTSFATARYGLESVAYDGYIYVMGGNDNQDNDHNDVQYAPINANGTLGTWQATTSFATARDAFGAAVYNGYMYIMGGEPNGGSSGSDVSSDVVQYAPINANGTLGTWQDTASFTTPRDTFGAVVYEGYIYVMGGYENSTGSDLSDVQYAPINANGTLGTWQTSSNTIGNGWGFGAAAYNGYIYAAGGDGGVQYVNYAQINPAGTIGRWGSSASSLPSATNGLASVAYNGHLYAIGGRSTSSGGLATVDYASINSDGTLGSWAAVNSLNTGVDSETAVAYNGYLYAIGGENSSGTIVKTVQYVQINSDGTLGTWATTKSLPTTTELAASVVYNGYVYEIGGQVTTSSTTNVVDYAPINAGGTLGSWASTTSLPVSIETAAAVTDDGYIYEIGGWTGGYSAVVYYTKIDTNGKLNITGTCGSVWCTTSSLPASDEYLMAAVSNGYIYVFGGTNSSGTIVATVDYAPINSDGTLGSWTATTSLSTATATGGIAAYNGYVYLVGGNTGSYTASVYYAPINNGGPGTTGSWTNSSTTFTTGRNLPAVVAYNSYLYILGGSDASGNALTDVQYAKINADGSLGSWTTSPHSLQAGRWADGAEAYNGYVYVFGGYSPGTELGSVEYAKINADGSLGTFAYTTSLNYATDSFVFAQYNGYLYVVGGNNSHTGATYLTTEYAQILSDGTLGSWQVSSNSLLTSEFQWGSGFAYNGYLYYLGGQDGSSDLSNSTEYTQINSNGSIGSWQYTTSFNIPRQGLTAAAIDGYVYVMGGSNQAGFSGAGFLNDVQYAPINSNGTIGNWQNTTTLATTTEWSTQAVYNGYLYNVGGANSSSNGLDVVQYAPVYAIPRTGDYSRLIDMTGNSGNGTVGSWQSTNALPTATYWGSAVAYNGYVYEIGGQTGTGNVATVDYAPINSSGGIGTWNPTTSLPAATYDATAVAYNGYLYEIGGDSSGGSTAVDYAPINSDGTLGSWTATASLPTGTASASSVVYNGYVYEIGGSTGGSTTTVDYALIDGSNGKLDINGSCGSPWCATTSLPTAVNGASSVVYNGYVYEIGGEASGGPTSAVDYAPINSDGTLGSWTATASLPTGTQIASSVVYNGFVYEVGGSNSSGVTSAVDYAPINSDGTLGSWTATTGLPTAVAESAAVIANGNIYEIGGYAGGSSLLATVDSVGVNANDPLLSTLMLQGSNTGNLRNNGIRVSYKIAGSGCPTFGSSVNIPVSGSTIFNSPIALPTATTGCGVNSNGRYVWLNVALDDSQTASFPDVNGNHTTITSFTGIYNPSPGSRLRGGATFSGGSLQSLYTRPGGSGTDEGSGSSPAAPVVASIGSNAAGDLNVPVPSGVTSGSLVVAFLWAWWGETGTAPGSSSITPPSGWTLGGSQAVTNTNGGSLGLYWYYHYATGADSGTYNFTANSVAGTAYSVGDGYAMRITGGPTSGNPFVDSLQFADSGSPSVNVGSFTPGGNDSLLLGGTVFANSTTNPSFPSGWTDAANGSDGDDDMTSVGDIAQTTATPTGSLTFSATGADWSFAYIATIRP